MAETLEVVLMLRVDLPEEVRAAMISMVATNPPHNLADQVGVWRRASWAVAGQVEVSKFHKFGTADGGGTAWTVMDEVHYREEQAVRRVLSAYWVTYQCPICGSQSGTTTESGVDCADCGGR